MHSSVADLISSIVDFNAWADFIPDPSSGLGECGGVPPPVQCTELASGLVTAIDLIESFFSGRNAFAFLSSTTGSNAIFSATILSFSVFHGSGESLILE